MSGLTPNPLAHLRDALGARMMDLELLAVEIGVGRTHLSLVLNGRRESDETMLRLRAFLPAAEWALLLQLQHFATWNAARLKLGRDAIAWQMRVECGWCRSSMGLAPCCAVSAGKASHGICPACYKIQMAGLDAMRPAELAEAAS